MNVFISWSGPRSRSFALVVHDWLLAVVQAAKPWMSDRGIGAGERWNEEITARLKDTDFGIICLTPANIDAPWLLFEAGALAKSIESARVVPVLIGLKKSDLKFPLAQFQSVVADREGMFELASSVNRAIPDKQLSLSTLNNIFNALWTDTEAKIRGLPADIGIEEHFEIRTERDLLEEISEMVRAMQRGHTKPERQASTDGSTWEDHFIRGVNLANDKDRGSATAVALLEYSKAIALAPLDLANNSRSRLYAYRGAMFKRLNRFEEAEADLGLALKWAVEKGEMEDANYNMACIEAMTGRHKEAIGRLGKLIGSNRKWAHFVANASYFVSLRNKPEFLRLMSEI